MVIVDWIIVENGLSSNSDEQGFGFPGGAMLLDPCHALR
jgi:hypothetical protein